MEQREDVETDPSPNGFAREPGWEYQKPLGKPKKTKQPKRSMPKPSKTIGKTKKNKKNKTFGPMTLFGDIGPKVCFVSPMVFDGFGIDLFGCFVFSPPQWFLIFSTGFTGKPVRRRICLYIFSLLHPLFLTKSSLISQCVAHSSSLDLNIDVASETCVPAIRMF